MTPSDQTRMQKRLQEGVTLTFTTASGEQIQIEIEEIIADPTQTNSAKLVLHAPRTTKITWTDERRGNRHG